MRRCQERSQLPLASAGMADEAWIMDEMVGIVNGDTVLLVTRVHREKSQKTGTGNE